ncbi:hypothetical protein [Chromobacterium sp. IIBBL 290-4]|uniref:hypothetical protein n=1 Tax=Chromobacterium sp. IIBBL 290-4 TaxID=2953890 RepID=UPI0020B800CB|nr:hypothetical protein [Chromobacterium sp. IIBBL 290-4]UTH72745.1 hypothetical protein NKT35_14490 [Chromobacterium sp. IIBBL 290-4]
MSVSAIGSYSSVSFAPAMPSVNPSQQAGLSSGQLPGVSQASSPFGNSGGSLSQNAVAALQITGLNVSGSGQSSATANGVSAQQAVNSFVLTLYQSVQAESLNGAGGSSSTSTNAGGYGGFQDNLQKLLQDVSNGVRNPATTKLMAAFKNLEQQLGGAPAAAPSQQAALHDFMQNLVNLQNNSQFSSSSGLGSLVNTRA